MVQVAAGNEDQRPHLVGKVFVDSLFLDRDVETSGCKSVEVLLAAQMQLRQPKSKKENAKQFKKGDLVPVRVEEISLTN